MNIIVRNEYRVEAELSDAELSELGVDFESLDYSDIETRRVLQTVLGDIRDAGIDISLSGRVLIEAQKLPGGCRLCFSVLSPRGDNAPSVKQLVKKPPLPVIFVCPDEKNAEKCRSFFKPGADIKIYSLEKKIVLYAESGIGENEMVRAGEFGEVYPVNSPLLPAFLNEYFGN